MSFLTRLWGASTGTTLTTQSDELGISLAAHKRWIDEARIQLVRCLREKGVVPA
jgi:hypothetical protein